LEKLDYHPFLIPTYIHTQLGCSIIEFLFNKLTKACDDDQDGLTPLSWTLIEGQQDLACILINKGANIDHRNPPPRYSQILLALNNHLFKAASLMIEKGADLTCKNDDGENALMLAIKRKNIELIRAMLDKGVNPLEKNNNDQDAFDYAGDNDSIVKLLNEYRHK